MIKKLINSIKKILTPEEEAHQINANKILAKRTPDVTNGLIDPGVYKTSIDEDYYTPAAPTTTDRTLMTDEELRADNLRINKDHLAVKASLRKGDSFVDKCNSNRNARGRSLEANGKPGQKGAWSPFEE